MASKKQEIKLTKLGESQFPAWIGLKAYDITQYERADSMLVVKLLGRVSKHTMHKDFWSYIPIPHPKKRRK